MSYPFAKSARQSLPSPFLVQEARAPDPAVDFLAQLWEEVGRSVPAAPVRSAPAVGGEERVRYSYD
ncbi:MAG: hypothetical protein COZ06_16795 [Armatimonadetes bacterium CG_4_10_14_3_um_filter_66_18]|nr:hypothetical protein [Armatimonadota bacterium]OIO94240.1 MAG: hypothetical protein AUJ96_29080 [Armatimonadetes bacterium CG2_30_66_41]PIU94458.1 MAG: hypothetical protein COS65_07535 [Armatimonadetes bacterium CG06_land_8_20_14_3_00_66_21]PIX46999.1 MAG: hypothetical protein COZ57_09690 [Armatimonadetes bacterium CG_4_8_14_3_um_filter_66_20]PIY48294.1 MAG: hypothetical protein COZ06_16795 [Armatimonadetes bacterium CG_4_10_14_3_um_filter_66_18]PIZ50447.1 MAG: hypothetical protein COY42_01